MRTTVTLDDELFERLKEIAHERGVSFKAVVNESIRSGIQRPRRRGRFKQETFSLGRPTVDLDRANRLAGRLQDQEALGKLREGR